MSLDPTEFVNELVPKTHSTAARGHGLHPAKLAFQSTDRLGRHPVEQRSFAAIGEEVLSVGVQKLRSQKFAVDLLVLWHVALLVASTYLLTPAPFKSKCAGAGIHGNMESCAELS